MKAVASLLLASIALFLLSSLYFYYSVPSDVTKSYRYVSEMISSDEEKDAAVLEAYDLFRTAKRLCEERELNVSACTKLVEDLAASKGYRLKGIVLDDRFVVTEDSTVGGHVIKRGEEARAT